MLWTDLPRALPDELLEWGHIPGSVWQWQICLLGDICVLLQLCHPLVCSAPGITPRKGLSSVLSLSRAQLLKIVCLGCSGLSCLAPGTPEGAQGMSWGVPTLPAPAQLLHGLRCCCSWPRNPRSRAVTPTTPVTQSCPHSPLEILENVDLWCSNRITNNLCPKFKEKVGDFLSHSSWNP